MRLICVWKMKHELIKLNRRLKNDFCDANLEANLERYFTVSFCITFCGVITVVYNGINHGKVQAFCFCNNSGIKRNSEEY